MSAPSARLASAPAAACLIALLAWAVAAPAQDAGDVTIYRCTGADGEVVIGNQIDSQVGTVCSVVFGAAHESTSRRAGELSNFLDMSDDLLAEPLRISGGRLPVPTAPGNGVVLDEDKLARYRTDR